MHVQLHTFFNRLFFKPFNVQQASKYFTQLLSHIVTSMAAFGELGSFDVHDSLCHCWSFRKRSLNCVTPLSPLGPRLGRVLFLQLDRLKILTPNLSYMEPVMYFIILVNDLHEIVKIWGHRYLFRPPRRKYVLFV